MGRFLIVIFVYGVMIAACCGIGLFMLIAPARFGNIIHDNLYLLPEIGPGDWGKKLALRVLGVGMLAFAIRLIVQIMRQAA